MPGIVYHDDRNIGYFCRCLQKTTDNDNCNNDSIDNYQHYSICKHTIPCAYIEIGRAHV